MTSLSTPVKIGGAVAVVLALVVGFWLVRPYFVDTVVDEDFPLSAGAVVPDDMTQEEVEAAMEDAADAPAVEAGDDMMPGEPTVVTSGSFVGADQFHQGEGSATIYQLEDGSHVLRFEDFEVTNGPDLHVYLSPLDENGVPQIDAPGSVDLGQLKGNVGNQNYDIPADVDLTQAYGIVIWCQPFRVTFATAALA